MKFYLDENLPKSVAQALHLLESHEGEVSVYSTEIEFGKGIKDLDLFPKIKEANGILISNDLKIHTRRAEFKLLQELELTAFLIDYPSGSNFWDKTMQLIKEWDKIKKMVRKIHGKSFVCKVKKRGEMQILWTSK